MDASAGHPWDDAVEALAAARDLLLAGSQQAGTQGQWELVKKLVDFAQQADALQKEVAALAPPAAMGEPGQAVPPAGRPRLPAKAAPEAYPRYAIRGEVLVKQGLQRNGRDVYEHGVPREEYDRLLGRLGDLAARQPGRRPKPFTMEDVHKGLDLPRYMAYAVLSLLLRRELLYRARKGAYLFADPERFAADAANVWHELEQTEQG